MSDQSLSPNNGSTQWQEVTSKNGNPYRVDKEEPIGTEKGEEDPALMEKKDFSIAVNWPVTVSRDWVGTTPEVRETAAITRYKLIHTPVPLGERRPVDWYDFELWFTNTEHYHYFFIDKTDDHYDNNTYRNRDHFVRYNSPDPVIVQISGF